MKKIFAKVYSTAGYRLGEWDELIFSGFTKAINSGLSDCVIELAETYDYTDTKLMLGNRVDIYVIDKDTTALPDGVLKIYSGFISAYEPISDGKVNKIVIRLMPYNTLLGLDILKKTNTTTLYTFADDGLDTERSFGDSTTQFDITNPAGSTMRYTWDGTGTDPVISATTIPAGTVMYIWGENFSFDNNGTFEVIASGANYFEITNSAGVAESNKTLGTGMLNAFSQPVDLVRILISAIDYFNANNDHTFSTNCVWEVVSGVNITYMFEQKTYREILDTLLSYAPLGWYYYIDENDKVYFQSKSTYNLHTFDITKHITSFNISRNLEKTKNVILLWNGNLGSGNLGFEEIYKNYEDTDSISKYGRRVLPVVDYGIYTEDTADEIGERLLAKNKDIEVKIQIEVADNNFDPVRGYDIESIQPGHTCTIRGFDKYSEYFQEEMVIEKVVYTKEKAVLTITVPFIKEVITQKGINKSVQDITRSSMPETYT